MTTHHTDRTTFTDHRDSHGSGWTSVTSHHCRGTSTHWVHWTSGQTTGHHHTTHGS